MKNEGKGDNAAPGHDRDGEGRFIGPAADKLRRHAQRSGVSDYHIDSIFKYERDPHAEIERLIELMQTPRGGTKYEFEPSELSADEVQVFRQMIAGHMEPETIV